MRTPRHRPWFVLVSLAAGAAASPPVHAFVRATTGYTTGVGLHWPTGCVRIAVPDPHSPSVAWDDLVAATTAAADTWNSAAATCGGHFMLLVERAQASGFGVNGDGVNAIILQTRDYCGSKESSPRCDPASLAITWSYNVDQPGNARDGELHEADIEINGESYGWATEPDPAAGFNDLQSVLTHELGHLVGLDHNCYESGYGLPRPVDDQGNPAPDCNTASSAIQNCAMFPEASYFQDRRALADDDIRGICAVYPQGLPDSCQGALAPAASGCVVGATSASDDTRALAPTKMLSLIAFVVGVTSLRRRRR